VLPPGSFASVQNPDGTVSLQPKDLASEKLFRQGQTAGRAAVVAEFTDLKTGLPKSDMHKNAMISIGIQFDQGGKPIVGAVTPTPTGTPTPAPSGSSAAPRAGTATPAATPAPTGAKAVTGKIGEPAAPALAPAPASAKTPEEIKAAIAAANEAIRGGAPVAAVKQRLADQGFPISGVGAK
jgi:hypothetical protein